MFSATLQLLDMLDAFKAQHDVGENPSANEIAQMFTLSAKAKTEILSASGSELRTEITQSDIDDTLLLHMKMKALAAAVESDDFNQNAPAASPRSAAPSHPAEGAARVGQRPTLDEVADSLERAVAATPRVKAKPLAHWYRAGIRATCIRTAIALVGHYDSVTFATDPDEVTCLDCRRRLAADRRRKPAGRKKVA